MKMIAYHGTDRDFDRFDDSFIGSRSRMQDAVGHFFVDSWEGADWFTTEEVFSRFIPASNLKVVMTCELQFDNPKTIGVFPLLRWDLVRSILEKAKNAGHDGTVFNDAGIKNNDLTKSRIYVAFSAKSVKIVAKEMSRNETVLDRWS